MWVLYELNILGVQRQGQALLALGLSQRLNQLKQFPPSQLALALQKRENLLRLVDPLCLGEFRWIAFQTKGNKSSIFETLFLTEPIS